MFDVHAAPDVIDRIGNDDDICAEYEAAGFSGIVLISHHDSTVGRAAALDRHSTMDVVGGVALSCAVGGINPAAVVAALTSGGRVVWFPTADSHTQQAAGLPRLRDLDARRDATVRSLPPLVAEDSSAARNAHHILDLIAEHDAGLCTGHVSRPECARLLDEAQSRGISRILLTHPSYTVPGMSPGEIEELTERGAYVEITAFQLWHQSGMTVEKLAAVAWAAGPRLDRAALDDATDSIPRKLVLT